MTNNLKQFLLKDKPFNTLLYISQQGGGLTTADIGRKNIGEKSHISRVVQEMEKLGLITRTKTGRRKVIELTEKGQQVGRAVERFNRELEEAKE